MESLRGISGAVSALGTIELVFRVFVYMAVIAVSIKAIQALNVYINKNMR